MATTHDPHRRTEPDLIDQLIADADWIGDQAEIGEYTLLRNGREVRVLKWHGVTETDYGTRIIGSGE